MQHLRQILSLLFLLAATAGPAGAAGKLYILGGAMGLSNAAVWQGILDDAEGGPIAVIPAASSSTVSAANLIVETFEEYAPNSAIAFNINGRTAANNQAIADGIRACKGVYFTGGDQVRAVSRMLNADGTPTLSLLAVMDVLNAGGVVAGSSAGAALMSDPMITGGTSSGALSSGTGNGGVSLGPGLGFFGGGMTDQHFLTRGRLGRLVVATMESPFELGFGVEEDSGLVVDLATNQSRVIGAMGVVVVDTRLSRREGSGKISGTVVHYLDTGDRMDLNTLEVVAAPGKSLITSPSFSSAITSTNVWNDFEVWRLMTVLADSSGVHFARGQDPAFDVYFIRNNRSSGYRGGLHIYENNRRAYTALDQQLLILPRGTPLIQEVLTIW